MKSYSYYIKERYNPQFEKPYYSAYGQLSKRQAAGKENTKYGFNTMLEYKSAEEYNQAIEQLRKDGYTVYSE